MSGVRVEHAKDIVPAVEQAIASPKPFIIDAIVSPGELTIPPHIEIKEAWAFGVSKVKEGLMRCRQKTVLYQADS